MLNILICIGCFCFGLFLSKRIGYEGDTLIQVIVAVLLIITITTQSLIVFYIFLFLLGLDFSYIFLNK